MSNVLDELRRAIEKDGRSRNAIAAKAGINPGHLSRLMKGEAGVSVERLEALADVLGYDVTLTRRRKGR